jgi:hypothetical protein
VCKVAGCCDPDGVSMLASPAGEGDMMKAAQ